MKIGFLGSGKMAEAILASVVNGGICEPWDVTACDISEERRKLMADSYDVVTTSDAKETVADCKVLVIAVRPQDLDVLLQDVKEKLTEKHLVISICAGKTLKVLRKGLGKKPRLIRVMPNLGLRVNEGMVVYCADKSAKPADKKLVQKIFSAAGKVLELAEKHMDAVTALSGSGPAFFAYCLQAMTEGGKELGLPKDAALLLAEQTMLGTAVYLQQTGADLTKFIQAVCSKGGTTDAGMQVLAASDVASVYAATLAAAAKRSAELA
ncbi:MAG: pyrroline-5-carboxylate reductase [Kiritimatiellae bacterium]|nr:pyrroline-5-carboxylate reductase [Kiritimatiellia bacterium]